MLQKVLTQTVQRERERDV